MPASTLLITMLASASLAGGLIDVRPVERVIDGQPVRGMSAIVDLTAPCLDVVVTCPLADASTSVEARLIPTDEWAIEHNTTLAINANYFAVISAREADVIGLSVSDGVMVSPARSWEGVGDPALVFTPNGASIGREEGDALAGMIDAVAGVGGSSTSETEGTLLVTDGENTGASARVEPDRRHPRTAVGVDEAGTRLIVLVVDGRQPDWSAGVTLPQLGELMIELGADDAINLDGGGSSSFVFVNEDGTTVTNRPSDGRFRPVANHLGFRCVSTGVGTDAASRDQSGSARVSGSGPR